MYWNCYCLVFIYKIEHWTCCTFSKQKYCKIENENENVHRKWFACGKCVRIQKILKEEKKLNDKLSLETFCAYRINSRVYMVWNAGVQIKNFCVCICRCAFIVIPTTKNNMEILTKTKYIIPVDSAIPLSRKQSFSNFLNTWSRCRQNEIYSHTKFWIRICSTFFSDIFLLRRYAW